MPPGSKKKNVKKRGQSKKRCDSKSESKEDDIKIKAKNKENEYTEKENKISTIMNLSKSIHQNGDKLEKNAATIYLEDNMEDNIDESEQEQKIDFAGFQNSQKQQFQQQKQGEIEENQILSKIEQIKVKLREQQFYLMGDKEQQALAAQLSNLLKQIPSKFNSMSTDKLIKEREKQKALLLSVQQISEQFLAFISIANKKLNPKDAHLKNYLSWIAQVVQKKNKKKAAAFLQENELGNQLGDCYPGVIQKNSQSIRKQVPYSINDLMKAEQRECLLEMEEKFQQLDKTKNMTTSKLKNIAKHINSLISQIKQLRQDNTTQTARNSILGSTAGNIQTLRDSYDSEIKYLKSKQLQEQTKNRVLAQKLAEAEQQEEKLIERGDKNSSLLESLEMNMAKFGDNQKIFSNYYRMRELKERMQRIVLELKNQQRFAEKQSEKKVKTLRHTQKNISEIQQQIDDKTNEIAAFNELIKEISLDPFSYQQTIREKGLKTYAVPPFFSFDYHLPQHLCTLSDIFDLQNYFDTQIILNETCAITYAPKCPEYACPLREEQMDERKIKNIIFLHKQSLSQTKLPQQNQPLVKFTSRSELQGIDSQADGKIPKSSSDIPGKQKNMIQNKPQNLPSQDEFERSFSQDILSFSHSPSLMEFPLIDNTNLQQQQEFKQQQQSEGLQKQQAQIKAQRNFVQKVIIKTATTGGLGPGQQQFNLDSKSSPLLNECQEGSISQRIESLQKDTICGRDTLLVDAKSKIRESIESSDQLKEALQMQKSVLCISPEQIRDPFSRHLLSRNGNHIKLTKKKDCFLATTSALTYLQILKSDQKETEKNKNQTNNQGSLSDLQDTGRSCSNNICQTSEFQIARKQFSQDTLLEKPENEILLFKESDAFGNQQAEKSLPKTNMQRPFSSFDLQKNSNQQNSDQMEMSTDKWSPMIPSRGMNKLNLGTNRIANSALAERQANNAKLQSSNPKGNFLDDFRKVIQKQKDQQQSSSQEKSSSKEEGKKSQLSNNNMNVKEANNQSILIRKEGGTSKQAQLDLVRSSTSKLQQNELFLRSKQPQPNSFSNNPQGQQQQQQNRSSLTQNGQLPFSREVQEVNSQMVIVKQQTKDIFSKLSRIASTNGSTQMAQKSEYPKVSNTSPLKTRSQQLGQKSEILQTEETGQESPNKLTDLAVKSSWKIQEKTENTQIVSQKRWTPGTILKRSSNSVVHTPHRQNGNTSSSVFREANQSQSQLKQVVNHERPFQQQQQQEQQQQYFPDQDLIKQSIDKSKGVVFFLKRSKSVFSKDDKGNITKNGSSGSNNSQPNNLSKQQYLQQSSQLKLQVVMNEEVQNSYFRPKGNTKRLVCGSKTKDLQVQNSKS